MGENTDLKIHWETRLCKVDGRLGYFHTWEQWSKPVGASPMIGGPPAGVIAQVFGIVEFENEVTRVDPIYIKFIDENNNDLKCMNNYVNYVREKENVET